MQKEITSLKTAGYRISVVLPHARDETIDGVQVCALEWPKGRLERFIRTPITAFWRAYNRQAVAYHVYFPELLCAAYLLRLLGFIVVFDIKEDTAIQFAFKRWIPGPAFIKRLGARAYDFLERFFLDRMSAVIASGSGIEQRVRSAKCKPIMIRNLPPLGDFQGVRSSHSGVTKRLFCAGGIRLESSTFQMIRALTLVPPDIDVELVLAGSALSGELAKLATQTEGWERTRYVGSISRSDLLRHMEVATAAVVLYSPEPNHQDIRSNRFYEAMAAGLPVIVPNFPIWKDFVESNRIGVAVDPANAESIASGISFILQNPDVAEKMGKAGRNLFIQDCNWEREEGKLISLYDELLASKCRPLS